MREHAPRPGAMDQWVENRARQRRRHSLKRRNSNKEEADDSDEEVRHSGIGILRERSVAGGATDDEMTRVPKKKRRIMNVNPHWAQFSPDVQRQLRADQAAQRKKLRNKKDKVEPVAVEGGWKRILTAEEKFLDAYPLDQVGASVMNMSRFVFATQRIYFSDLVFTHILRFAC